MVTISPSGFTFTDIAHMTFEVERIDVGVDDDDDFGVAETMWG